jgi:hypothetical protein
MPSAEQIPGIQSTNLMCTSDPLRGLRENEATSIRKKNPAANWGRGGVLALDLDLLLIGVNGCGVGLNWRD